MTWNTEIVVIGVTIAAWVLFYNRMVPLVFNPSILSGEEMIEKMPSEAQVSLLIPDSVDSDSSGSSTPSSYNEADRRNTFDSTMPLTSKRAQNISRI